MYPKNYDANLFVSKAGSRFKPEYRGIPQDNGFIELVVVSTIDLWELHNADAESCDINNIVARFASGDVSALEKVQGSYIDVSGLPKDLRGMSDLIDGMRNVYNNLNPDVQQKFSSFQDWLERAGSESWLDIMSDKRDDLRSENVQNSNDNIENK